MSKDDKRDVKKTNEAVPSTTTSNFFEKYGRGAGGSRDHVGDLVKFTKFGEYRAGKYDDEIKLGTHVVAYMNSLCTGWTLWENNRPIEQIMGPVGEGFVPPRRDTLGHRDQSQWTSFDSGEPKDPWAFTNTIVLIDRAGPEPRFYTFSTSSKGGVGALALLALQYGEHMRQKPGEYPIIELDRDSYQHSNRNYGEIRVPVFEIVGWVPAKDLPPIPGVSGEQPKLAGSGGDASF
jgi:hypothetical protein